MNPIEQQTAIDLDNLYQYRIQIAQLDIDKSKLKNDILDRALTPEIKKQLADIDAEFEPQYDAVVKNTNALDTKIRNAVKTLGYTVPGRFLQCVFASGKKSWDSAKLNRYVKNHPDLEECFSIGDPSCSIREVKQPEAG